MNFEFAPLSRVICTCGGTGCSFLTAAGVGVGFGASFASDLGTCPVVACGILPVVMPLVVISVVLMNFGIGFSINDFSYLIVAICVTINEIANPNVMSVRKCAAAHRRENPTAISQMPTPRYVRRRGLSPAFLSNQIGMRNRSVE